MLLYHLAEKNADAALKVFLYQCTDFGFFLFTLIHHKLATNVCQKICIRFPATKNQLANVVVQCTAFRGNGREHKVYEGQLKTENVFTNVVIFFVCVPQKRYH